MQRRNFIFNIGLLSGGLALVPSLMFSQDSLVRHDRLQANKKWLEVNEVKVNSILRFFENDHYPTEKDIFQLNVVAGDDHQTIIYTDKEELSYSEKIKILDKDGIINTSNSIVHLVSGEANVNGTLLTGNQFAYLNKGRQDIKLVSGNSRIVLVSC